MSVLKKIWRHFFPAWEKRWCIATSAVNPNWRWIPYQVWYRNGEPDIRYAFLHIIPVKPGTEEHAAKVANDFIQIARDFEAAEARSSKVPPSAGDASLADLDGFAPTIEDFDDDGNPNWI